MTRVWRCNGWVTSRQRSFEMKRQSVFLQRRVEDGWSVGWIFEVFRRSMKCSPSAHHFKRLPQICFRCQWLWHLPPRTACWAANLWEILWIMVTTSFEKGVKLCGRESYLLTFHEFGRWWNMIQSQIEILFGVSGWWSFWRLWSDHNHRRSWDLGSCDFPVISTTLINLQVSDGAGGLGPWQKGFFRFFLRSSTWMLDDVKLALTHLWIPSCLNFWTSNVDP